MTDLREQIFEAIADIWPCGVQTALGECATCDQRANHVMAVVGPALDAKDTEIAQLAFEKSEVAGHLDLLRMEASALVDENARLGEVLKAEAMLRTAVTITSMEAEATIARVRQMADAWEQRLPEMILTATAVEALRMATERYALAQPDDQPKDTP